MKHKIPIAWDINGNVIEYMEKEVSALEVAELKWKTSFKVVVDGKEQECRYDEIVGNYDWAKALADKIGRKKDVPNR